MLKKLIYTYGKSIWDFNMIHGMGMVNLEKSFIRKVMVLLSITIIGFAGISTAEADTTVKVGGVCKTVNKEVKNAGKTLTCTKVGTKLVWKVSKVTSAAVAGCPKSGTVIAYTPISGEHAWFTAITDRLRERAKACGVKLMTFDPAGDAAKQAAGIENLITSGAKAIAISAVDAKAIGVVVAQAKKKGIFIIQHVSEVPAFDANVGVPEPDFGRLIGDIGGKWLLKTKPGNTNYQVAILNADSLGAGLLLRKQGLIDGLKSALGGAKFTIVSDVEAYAQDKALDATAAILAVHPKLDLVLCVNDAGALGAMAAFLSAGLIPSKDVASVGSLTKLGLEAVIAGKMPGGITVPGVPHGDALANVMFGLLNGKIKPGTPASNVLVPPTQIMTVQEAKNALKLEG